MIKKSILEKVLPRFHKTSLNTFTNTEWVLKQGYKLYPLQLYVKQLTITYVKISNIGNHSNYDLTTNLNMKLNIMSQRPLNKKLTIPNLLLAYPCNFLHFFFFERLNKSHQGKK